MSFAAPLTLPGDAPGETVLRLPAEGQSADIAALAGRTLTVTLVDGSRAMEGTVTPAARARFLGAGSRHLARHAGAGAARAG